MNLINLQNNNFLHQQVHFFIFYQFTFKNVLYLKKKYISNIMNLRKFRTHLHGFSNRKTNPNQSLINHLTFQVLPPHRQISSKPITLPSSSQGRKKQPLSIYSTQRITNLRQLFKNKRNIKKIIKGWELNQKGYLTSEDLKQKLKTAFNFNISNDQVIEITKKFSKGEQGKIDTEDFLNLIFCKSENSYITGAKIGHHDLNQVCKSNINNLLEQINYKKDQPLEATKANNIQKDNQFMKIFNTCISKLKHVYPNKQSITSEVIFSNDYLKDQEKYAFQSIASKLGYCQILQSIYNNQNLQPTIIQLRNKKIHKLEQVKAQLSNTYKSYEQKAQPPQLFLNTVSGWSKFSRLNSTKKSQFLHPIKMNNVDQRKTRSGATNFSTNVLIGSNFDEYSKNTTSSDVLRAERQRQKILNMNKINKMKLCRQRQKQNIEQQMIKADNIHLANLKKRRDLANAYNYVNFIKNQWL